MNLSFQLDSARNAGPWERVINDIAELGYTQTEGFPGIYGDPPGFRRLLDMHGLKMPSGHFALDTLEGSFSRTMDIADALGMSRIYCPMLARPDRPSDEAGWRAFAPRLQDIWRTVRESGRDFGWHNHDFEFRVMADGAMPMREILEGAPDIGWEADIAWIVRGGGEPMDWIERYGKRTTAAHVKDIAPSGECEDEDGWADVGHGVLDWYALTAALRGGGCDLFVVEHDRPSDAGRFARRSLASFRSY